MSNHQFIQYLEQTNNPLRKAVEATLNQKDIIPSQQQELLQYLFQTHDKNKNIIIPPNLQFGIICQLPLDGSFYSQYIEKINRLSTEYINFYLFKHISNPNKNQTIYDSFNCGFDKKQWKSDMENHSYFPTILNQFIIKVQKSLKDYLQYPFPYSEPDYVDNAKIYALSARLSLLGDLNDILNKVNHIDNIDPLFTTFNQDFKLGFQNKLTSTNPKLSYLLNTEWNKVHQFIFNANKDVFEKIIENMTNILDNDILKHAKKQYQQIHHPFIQPYNSFGANVIMK